MALIIFLNNESVGWRQHQNDFRSQTRLLEYRAQFRKLFKAFFAMVVTHTAVTNTAKWHIVLSNMEHTVVDAYAATKAFYRISRSGFFCR